MAGPVAESENDEPYVAPRRHNPATPTSSRANPSQTPGAVGDQVQKEVLGLVSNAESKQWRVPARQSTEHIGLAQIAHTLRECLPTLWEANNAALSAMAQGTELPDDCYFTIITSTAFQFENVQNHGFLPRTVQLLFSVKKYRIKVFYREPCNCFSVWFSNAYRATVFQCENVQNKGFVTRTTQLFFSAKMCRIPVFYSVPWLQIRFVYVSCTRESGGLPGL